MSRPEPKQFEFQVIRDGAVVFRRNFPGMVENQVAETTAMAIHDLHNKRPDLSLFDQDIIMKWIDLEV